MDWITYLLVPLVSALALRFRGFRPSAFSSSLAMGWFTGQNAQTFGSDFVTLPCPSSH